MNRKSVLTRGNFTLEAAARRGRGLSFLRTSTRARISQTVSRGERHAEEANRDHLTHGKRLKTGLKTSQTPKTARRQDGGQTEDPNGQRETQQEHYFARKRGQDNGEFYVNG